jgi:chitinase
LRRAACFVVALVLAGCAHEPAPAPRHEIVGYYAGWKKDTPVDASLLTVINYAFLDVAPDGRLVLLDPAVDEAHFARLSALKPGHPHLRLVASVGGWTRSYGFSDMAADPIRRAAFVDSSIAFLRRYGFDGIDIDWEYPGAIGVACEKGRTCDRPEDKRNFVILARELRAALDTAGTADRRRYLATIAAGAERAYIFDGDSAAWLAQLAASLDWINLMTYDYHGTWEKQSGMLAPLLADPEDVAGTNVEGTVRMFTEAGVPPSKLTLGIPFYGKGWVGCAPGPRGDGLYQPCAAPVSDPPEATFEFWRLRTEGYLEGRGFHRHWRAAAQAPYLYAPATRIFITYEDPRSVRAKMAYLQAKGLRGAMFWELSSDHDFSLGRTIAEQLSRWEFLFSG